MKIPLELGIRLHGALVKKRQPYDICQVTDILISYLSQMLLISEDCYKNKVYLWQPDDYERMIGERNEIKTRVVKLLNMIDDQCCRFNDSITKYKTHAAKMREAKRLKSLEKATKKGSGEVKP